MADSRRRVVGNGTGVSRLPATPRQTLTAAAAGVAAVIVLILLVNGIGGLHAVSPSEVCVVQEGGPFDGRGISAIRQPSEGLEFVGAFNKQRCFPATQRNYIISADPASGDKAGVDFVEVPTRDAVNVRIEGAAYFQLNTDPVAIRSLYLRYGVRTFDGIHPYEGEQGWDAFLDQNFRPVLDNALREAIGGFDCVQLNGTCQYVTSASEAVKGNVQKVDTTQNLASAQDKIAETLQADLNSSLDAPPGHPYFTGIRFRLRLVRFDESVQKRIDDAVAARTQVATARLQGQQRVEAAIADRRVAEQRAQAIRSTRGAYRDNPSQARIDAIKALPSGLRALGGSTTQLLDGR